MVFELVIVDKNIKNKKGEYVRWREVDGPEEDYVGLDVSYNSMKNWVKQEAIYCGHDDEFVERYDDIFYEEIHKETIKMQSRYFFILETDLVLTELVAGYENVPKKLTVYSDGYSIDFTKESIIIALNNQCYSRAVGMALGTYNATSNNPFGRYDNSPDDPDHYFIFQNQSVKDKTQRYFNTLRSGLILTDYELYSIEEYKNLETDITGNNQASSRNKYYDTEINKGSIIKITTPSDAAIVNTQNEKFTEDFIKPEPPKIVTTNATIITLRTSAYIGRPVSQQQVMNGNSANIIAEALQIRGAGINLEYEWLHLSAFSFGTPNDFPSAQSLDNLVLGTSAANSQMLLFETQIQNTLRIGGGVYRATINVNANCPTPINTDSQNGYVSWYADQISYDVIIISEDNFGKKRKLIDQLAFNFSVIFNPFQTVTPTVAEQHIVKSLLTEFRNVFDQNKKQKNNELITAVHPSLQRLLVRRPSKPAPHQLESVNINLFGRTNVPAIRETRHQLRLTTVDTPYLAPGDQPFSFAQLFGGVLSSASWLLFDNAQFTVREEDEQFFLEFDGDLRMDTGNPLLTAFKDLLGADATLTVGGGLLLKNEITDWEDLLTMPDPSYIDLGAAATFTRPLIPHTDSTDPVNSSIVLTNLGLELTIFRKINLMSLGEGINALNLPEEWATWVFLSGTVEFHNLNSPEPVVLQAELQYTPENIMVNASVSGVQNLFGLEALSFDYLGAQFVYGQDPKVALSAIYTPFAKSFEFGGIMSSAGVGIYCNAEEFDFNDLNDIFNNLTGADLHLPDWDITFENVRISLSTADGLVIGPETLNRGLFISATVRIRDYAASVTGEFTPNGVHLEGSVIEMVQNPELAEGMTLNSLHLIIDLNKTASEFMFSGELSYSGLTLDCSVHVEKEGENWNETLYAELHGPSFGLSTLFPSTANTILDTLRFSDAAIIISNYDGTYYKGDTLYNVTHGVHLKGILEEIPFISTLIHSRQIGLQLSADLGGSGGTNSLTIAMPQSTALQLGNAVYCEPFGITANLTPTPNLMLDFGFSLINIPNQGPLQFDLSLDVGIAEAEAAATMQGTIQNFMGITGLEVGPELGLEVGIIYEQFAVSGIPSELALAAGASYAGTAVDFALKISENPDEEIMYAHVGDISVNTLVNMIETFVPQIGTVHVPNFLTINDMTLYCAPMGGQIGVLKFEPGMNFSASLILGGTAVDIMAYFSKNGYTDPYGNVYAPGLYAAGKVQRFTLGPLTVTGLNGQDAEVSLAIAGAQSQLYVDCAIEFYGALCGGYLKINSSGAVFDIRLVISDILYIDFNGAGNRNSSDFTLTATLNNNFNTYLSNLVITKLNQGFAYLEHEIDELQHKVDEAYKTLNDALDAVNATLAEKKADVQTYLHSCQDDLVAAQAHMDHAIQDAMNDVENAKANFDRAFDEAKQLVQDAQNAFDAKMREKEADLNSAQRQFDTDMITAQQNLDKAQGKWDAVVGNAVAAVTAARNKVDGLNRDIADAQKQVDDSHWYSEDYYKAKRDAIIIAKDIAEGILTIAINVLNAIQSTADYGLFHAAQIAFDEARSTGDGLVREAEAALDAVRQGTEYIALQQVQNALSLIQTGADYTVWKAAEAALEGLRKVEQDLIDVAQYAIDHIAETAVYHAFQLAEDVVTAVQNGPLALAYNAATAALTTVNQDLEKMNQFADDLVAEGLGAFQINTIRLTAAYSSGKIGLFQCDAIVTILGCANHFSMSLDLNKLEDFAKQIYDTMMGNVNQLLSQYESQ